ncbi:MAG: diguanylate cyclase [Synergistaceae bacterium]|nr:diguanylate cyclase [Synergistaceae bacterium]
MKLIIAGLGPGDFNLITVSALKHAENSDLILIPKSHKNNIQGVAENIIRNFVSDKKFMYVFFPMINDSKERNKIIHDQIENIKSVLESSNKIFFPVIGDSLLYSTAAYLIEELKQFFPDIELIFIPGISAHSLAAACAKKFLAMSDEILSIIPGTADPEKIKLTLQNSNCAAIYKPTAIKNIKELITKYEKIIRVDFAGIPDKEKIYEGEKALENINEYLSIILLWNSKNSQQINQELEYQKRILEMARQDYLTGLATRWYLNEYIENNKDEKNITCIYFDLDNFKFVNDTYGHGAGDRALAATAEMIQREFTDGFAARMGGDEFMLVLTGERNVKEVESKVNNFMKKLLEYYAQTKTMKTLSISAGISQKLQHQDKTIDRLIHESDIALYDAKKNGRACCKIYQPSMEL